MTDWLIGIMHSKPGGEDILWDYNPSVSVNKLPYDPSQLNIIFNLEPKNKALEIKQTLADFEREEYYQLKSRQYEFTKDSFI